METLELLCTVGGNMNWCSRYGKQYGSASKKLKIELPYDLAVPFLSIYPKEWKSGPQRDSHSHVDCSISHNSRDVETT